MLKSIILSFVNNRVWLFITLNTEFFRFGRSEREDTENTEPIPYFRYLKREGIRGVYNQNKSSIHLEDNLTFFPPGYEMVIV